MPSPLLLATKFSLWKVSEEGSRSNTCGRAEAATDCKAARVICTAAPPHTCTAFPSSFCSSSSSLTETHKHHNFCKDNFRELQKESLDIFGRTGCKHCCARWPVRSYGLCLKEMDEKVQVGSWMKTQLSIICFWICGMKAIDCREKSWARLLKYTT